MKRYIHGVWILCAALAMIGCGTARSPQTVIAPAYSFVQADLAAGRNQTHQPGFQSETSVTVIASKLPPIPAAPGFETYVLAPIE